MSGGGGFYTSHAHTQSVSRDCCSERMRERESLNRVEREMMVRERGSLASRFYFWQTGSPPAAAAAQRCGFNRPHQSSATCSFAEREREKEQQSHRWLSLSLALFIFILRPFYRPIIYPLTLYGIPRHDTDIIILAFEQSLPTPSPPPFFLTRTSMSYYNYLYTFINNYHIFDWPLLLLLMCVCWDYFKLLKLMTTSILLLYIRTLL